MCVCVCLLQLSWGVAFSTIWEAYLWNRIIRRDRTLVSLSLWKGRILASITAGRHTQPASSHWPWLTFCHCSLPWLLQLLVPSWHPRSPFTVSRHLCTNWNGGQFPLDAPAGLCYWLKSISATLTSVQLYLWQLLDHSFPWWNFPLPLNLLSYSSSGKPSLTHRWALSSLFGEPDNIPWYHLTQLVIKFVLCAKLITICLLSEDKENRCENNCISIVYVSKMYLDD